MHFLVFIPGAKGAPDDLERVGLGDLRAEAECRPAKGPDGDFGHVFGWRPGNGELRLVVTDEQTWIPASAPGEPGRYSIGFWNAHPCRAGNLLRRVNHGGVQVVLGDGCEWTVPRPCDLPHAFKKLPNGEWRPMPAAAFARYVAEAQLWEARIKGEGEQQPKASEVLDFATRALAVNYRITPEVVSHLELFTAGDNGSVAVIFNASIGAGGDS